MDTNVPRLQLHLSAVVGVILNVCLFTRCCAIMDSAQVKRKIETTEETDQKKAKTNLDQGRTLTKDLEHTDDMQEREITWREIRAENLKCDYCLLYRKSEADELVRKCDTDLVYNAGELSKVFIFGKWQDIPRQQVAFGDPGLSYTFSGHTVPARPWLPFLEQIRDNITKVTGYDFNFVLINRYKDGSHYIGEHRDDEKDLTPGHPIASLSLGQKREFVFKHADSRGKNAKRKIDTVKIELEHGCLLMMKHPTNTYWYHSLPARKSILGARINMTFRKMVLNKKKPLPGTNLVS